MPSVEGPSPLKISDDDCPSPPNNYGLVNLSSAQLSTSLLYFYIKKIFPSHKVSTGGGESLDVIVFRDPRSQLIMTVVTLYIGVLPNIALQMFANSTLQLFIAFTPKQHIPQGRGGGICVIAQPLLLPNATWHFLLTPHHHHCHKLSSRF